MRPAVLYLIGGSGVGGGVAGKGYFWRGSRVQVWGLHGTQWYGAFTGCTPLREDMFQVPGCCRRESARLHGGLLWGAQMSVAGVGLH